MIRNTFENWIERGRLAQCSKTVELAKLALACWAHDRDEAAKFYLNEARKHYKKATAASGL
jgi:hypothetical protein